MSFQTYDLDSSDSSDSIPQKPQKRSKKTVSGYSNDQLRRYNSKSYADSDDSEKSQPQDNTKKTNKIKKSILSQKNQYDIQDSDDDENNEDEIINYNNKNTNKITDHHQYSRPEKKIRNKKKFASDYDNDNSDNSQNNINHIEEPNCIKARAYSYAKSHKNINSGLLNFDLSDNDEDHYIDYTNKDQKQKSTYSDSNSRSSTKYSKTIGGGENSLTFRSKEFTANSKNQNKNVIRTNDFSSSRSPKSQKSKNKPKYTNYDSDGDSYDDNNYNENNNPLSEQNKKRNTKNMHNMTDSDNESLRKNNEKTKIENERVKSSSSSTLNENNDWSFPMNYVPEPDDMKEIIEDYHEKYSIDFLLRRIINNPSCRSSNDE